MTKQFVINAVQSVVEEMRNEIYIPYDTGNLAKNALRINITSEVVVVFIDQSIAPYMPYTNEPWTAVKWNGKQNPNEGWWERFVEEFTKKLAVRLRGEIKK